MNEGVGEEKEMVGRRLGGGLVGRRVPGGSGEGRGRIEAGDEKERKRGTRR